MSYGRIWDGSEWKYNFLGVYHSGVTKELDLEDTTGLSLSIGGIAGVKIYDEKVYIACRYTRYIYVFVCDMDLNPDNAVVHNYECTNSTDIISLYFDINKYGLFFSWTQKVSGYSQIFTARVDHEFDTWIELQQTTGGITNWSISDMQQVEDITYIIYGSGGNYKIAYCCHDPVFFMPVYLSSRPTKLFSDTDKGILCYTSRALSTGRFYTGYSTTLISGYVETQRSLSSVESWAMLKKDNVAYFATLGSGATRDINFGSFRDNEEQSDYKVTTLLSGLGPSALRMTMHMSNENPVVYLGWQNRLGPTYSQIYIGYCGLNGTGFISDNVTSDAYNHSLAGEYSIFYNPEPKRIYFAYTKDISGTYYPFVGYQDFVFKSRIKYYDGSTWK